MRLSSGWFGIRLDFDKLKEIHRYLFQDVYEWVGKPRSDSDESPNQFKPSLLRQAQTFEIEHVDRAPIRRSAPDVRFEVVVGQAACLRLVKGSSAVSKSSLAAPFGSSLSAAIQRRLFSGSVGTRMSTSPVASVR
jgi:hypothetical protein